LERRVAADIYKSLCAAKEAFDSGKRGKSELIEVFKDGLGFSGLFKLEYVEVREKETLASYDEDNLKAPLMLCAAILGGVRLIDNIDLR
jgi:pantothenate synthetase